MGLLKCKGCGNMVSSEAETCPKCGFFVRLSMERQEEASQQVTPPLDIKSGGRCRKGLIAVIAIFIALIVCGGIGWVVYNHNVGEQITIVNAQTTIEITPELAEAVQRYDGLKFGFHEGLATVVKGPLYGFINKNGEEVISCIYDDAGFFHEGLAKVWKHGYGEGFVNKNGEEVIPCIYDRVNIFF